MLSHGLGKKEVFAATVILLLASGVGLFAVITSQHHRGDRNAVAAPGRFRVDSGPPSVDDMGATTMEITVPDANGQEPDELARRVEQLFVDVASDGALMIFGEPTPFSRLRLMLDEQIHENVKTHVVIRPTPDCPFRFIRPVLAVCDELGISHDLMTQNSALLLGSSAGPMLAILGSL